MKVKVAETAGFCFGVKRAVDKVYELIDTEQKPIFTLGPIIHNEGVVADLEARGVHVITEADLDSPDDTLQNGTVVIRSHGVGKPIYDKLKEKNIGILITDHNAPETLSITDRAYLLFEGKILFQGTSEELAENPVVREKYLGRNFIFHRKKFL